MRNQGHENYQNCAQHGTKMMPNIYPESTRGQNRSQNGSQHDPKINPKHKNEETKTKSAKTEEPPTFFGRAFWALGVQIVRGTP